MSLSFETRKLLAELFLNIAEHEINVRVFILRFL